MQRRPHTTVPPVSTRVSRSRPDRLAGSSGDTIPNCFRSFGDTISNCLGEFREIKERTGIAAYGHPAGTPGAGGVERLLPRENGQRLGGEFGGMDGFVRSLLCRFAAPGMMKMASSSGRLEFDGK